MGFFFPSGQNPDAHDFLRLNSQTYFITFLYKFFFHHAHLVAEQLKRTHTHIPCCWGCCLQLSQGATVWLLHFLWESLISLLSPRAITSESVQGNFQSSQMRPQNPRPGWISWHFPRTFSIFLLWQESFVLNFYLAPFSLNTDSGDSRTLRVWGHLLLLQRFTVVRFPDFTHSPIALARVSLRFLIWKMGVILGLISKDCEGKS